MSVRIANAALDHVLAAPLSRLDERSKTADLVRRHHDKAIRWVLRQRFWSEVSLTQALDALALDPSTKLPDAMCYAFALPPRFLRAYRVLGVPETHWRVMQVMTPHGPQMALVCTKSAVDLEYVFEPDDIEVLPDDVVDLIALRLAYYLCNPLKADKSLRRDLKAELDLAMMDAGDISEAQDRSDNELDDGPFLEARHNVWAVRG